MYNDYVEINKNFQTSVNIDYDLGNTLKVKEYIPTSDVCDVLKIYFKAILKKEKNNATILVGPYGKGKSFLVLVLLQLICFKDDKNVESLLNKIESIDKELLSLIKEFKEKNRKYLPVVVDSNYHNIEQSFLLSLNESLKAAGLNDIIPNTVYGVCLELLNKWEKDKEVSKKVLNECSKKFNISIDDLRQELSLFDINGYKKFENIYNCVTTGLSFNPMINSDVVKIYSDVNHQLYEKGYEGIFIIYDEFNKTLEAKNEYLAKDLKLIQDFAEKANRSSKEEQMHLCCITHKSLALYQDKSNENLLDSFKTVEGRFKEIRFNRSLDQNYQIISLSINKKPNFSSIYKTFKNENKVFIDKLSKNELFEDINTNDLLEGCFPFNPISVYSLIQLSELVAQNERTMFTLISDNDENSFSSFVTNNDKGLYDIDKLYDYFYKAMSADNGNIKSIWYKCESSLLQVKKKIQKRILKALACIRMINDFSKLSPSIEILSLGLMQDESIINSEVEELIKNKILKKTFGNEFIDFALSNTKQIDTAIDNYLAQKRGYKKDSTILEQIYPSKYLIPRKYNAQNKITRYFKSIFVEEKEFFALNSFDVYFEQEFCDGLVINIINATSSKNIIKNKYKEIKNNINVVVRVSTKKDRNIIEEVRKIDALENIKDNGDFDEVTKSQILILLKENKKNVTLVLENYLKKENSFIIDSFDSQNINISLQNICEKCYCDCPIVNNEMINKESLSSSYKKSRDNIVNYILERKNPFDTYSKTSPEITVYNSFYDDYDVLNNESNKIISKIKAYLQNGKEGKKELSEIVFELKERPYGIRTGILPIYFAATISNLSDNTILYFDEVEIEINPLNIDKFCHKPEKYKLLIEKKSKEQEEYLKGIINEFDGTPSNSYYANLHTASKLINRWFTNLPIALKEIKQNDNYLDMPMEFFEIRKLFLRFNINDYDALIKKMPAIFNGSLKKVLSFFENKDKYIKKLDEYSIKLSKDVKEIFNKNYKGSINGCIKEWLNSEQIILSNILLDGRNKDISKTINVLSFEDVEAINQLSSSIIKYRLQDWTSNNTDVFINAIKDFTVTVVSNKNTKRQKESVEINIKDKEISDMGKMFENNIESVIDEFNDSISNEEKAYILIQVIKKFTGE